MLNRTLFSHSLRAAVLRLLLGTLATTNVFAQHFVRTDLTQNRDGLSATAVNIDPNLVNAWGLSRSSGSFWWVSDADAGVATLYDGAGVAQSLVVTIPVPDGNGGTANPTGTVFNYTTGFEVAPGKPAVFLFVTEGGTIAGWNPTVNLNAAILVNRSKKASYKGVAIAQRKDRTYLYAANFLSGKIDVFNSSFHRVHLDRWAFRDPRVPPGYAPFNIQNVGGNLVVAFAKKEADGDEEEAGPGLGFVSIFNARGRLVQRLQHGKFLNAPWGITLAPTDFGVFGHRLLIGNFGDGQIHAFNAVTGEFDGTLLDESGQPLQIDGLWALGFGNNANAGSALELYFTAGPNEEADGLLGKIVPVSGERRGNTE
jgi:uncharacterized protein (TIGR03118 family)